MTNKENCAGSYYVSGYTRADGKEVSGYMRTCGAAHASNNSDADRENKLQRRAELLYPNTPDKRPDKNKNYPDEIAGVKRGEPMSLEQAGGNNVNPDFNPMMYNSNNTNCQSAVAVFEARMRGYDVETAIPNKMEDIEIQNKLSVNSNFAYIDPITGKTPEFTTLKVNNALECEQLLDENIRQGERYAFSFVWKDGSHSKGKGHIIEVWKDKNNKLEFYDPQSGASSSKYLFLRVKYKFTWNEYPDFPRILRLDNKELNYKVLNGISKPARKKKY
ncbi:MAG: hypothetical protein LUH05_09770 [Candidatus Gastranaerophilales bacterium]|nr:hypothetical protein [Candidatus Gastranaerophilales bacterium]